LGPRVGKTEIAPPGASRGCPFIKVEASKYTEVGYSDGTWNQWSVILSRLPSTRSERKNSTKSRPRRAGRGRTRTRSAASAGASSRGRHSGRRDCRAREQTQRTREKLRLQLREGKLDSAWSTWKSRARYPSFEIISTKRVEEMDVNIRTCFPACWPAEEKTQK